MIKYLVDEAKGIYRTLEYTGPTEFGPTGEIRARRSPDGGHGTWTTRDMTGPEYAAYLDEAGHRRFVAVETMPGQLRA